jgi:High potential iron-sulfur protein
MHDPSRRLILRRALQLTTALAVTPRLTAAAPGASCVDPQSESLRASLHYAGVSPVAGQNCGACGFFTAVQGGCGTCVIMSGPVDATGHCDSWSAKS